MNHTTKPDLLTPKQAAQILGIKEGTLSVWRSTGRYDLPYVKVGRRVKYRQSDLNAYLNQHTYCHTGETVNNNP